MMVTVNKITTVSELTERLLQVVDCIYYQQSHADSYLGLSIRRIRIRIYLLAHRERYRRPESIISREYIAIQIIIRTPQPLSLTKVEMCNQHKLSCYDITCVARWVDLCVYCYS